MEIVEKRIRDIAYNARNNDRLIGEAIQNVLVENDVSTYDFKGYKFQVTRRKFLDVNGNPIYLIKPLGDVNELPEIDGFRRSFKKWHYSTQSYNIDMYLYIFFLKMNVHIINNVENPFFISKKLLLSL